MCYSIEERSRYRYIVSTLSRSRIGSRIGIMEKELDKLPMPWKTIGSAAAAIAWQGLAAKHVIRADNAGRSQSETF